MSSKTNLCNLILPGYKDEVNIITLSRNFENLDTFFDVFCSYAVFDLSNAEWIKSQQSSDESDVIYVYTCTVDISNYSDCEKNAMLNLPHFSYGRYCGIDVIVNDINSDKTKMSITFFSINDPSNSLKLCAFTGFLNDIGDMK